jgi:hypothetical protein
MLLAGSGDWVVKEGGAAHASGIVPEGKEWQEQELSGSYRLVLIFQQQFRPGWILWRIAHDYFSVLSPENQSLSVCLIFGWQACDTAVGFPAHGIVIPHFA